MSIIRTIKDSNNPYVLLNKTALQDSNLSFKAKGIFSYLMSKPNNWKCQVKDLMNNATDGRDSIMAGLRELRCEGYLIKRPIHNKFGKITEWEELLFEIPQDIAKEIYKEQQYKLKTRRGKSVNGKPVNGKPVVILSTNNNNNNNNNNDSTTQLKTTNVIDNKFNDKKQIENDNITLIKEKTHLLLSENKLKKVKKWNTLRLLKSIEIFKEKNGEYFSFLEKIYLDDRNFAINNKDSSKNKVNKFNDYEQRDYNFEELEKKLLGWE